MGLAEPFGFIPCSLGRNSSRGLPRGLISLIPGSEFYIFAKISRLVANEHSAQQSLFILMTKGLDHL